MAQKAHGSKKVNTEPASMPDKALALRPLFTPFLSGPLGLNLVPSARFDKEGTLTLTAGTSDPYSHLALGAQISDRLYLGLRQSAEVSSIDKLSDELYPGVDFKFKLIDESSRRPAIALGAQSAFGHKRMAAEYLVASKKAGLLDLSAGMAWGRLGTAGHMRNPLRHLGGHFDKKRSLEGQDPNAIDDWFTGEDIGFFGGVQFMPPNAEYTFKLDWGADRYVRELAVIDGFEAPDPWSLSVEYSPLAGVNGALGLVGGEKIMGRLTLRGNLRSWRYQSGHLPVQPPPVYPYRTSLYEPGIMRTLLEKERLKISPPVLDGAILHTKLNLPAATPSPQAYGRVARHAAFAGGETVEAVRITPVSEGLEGRAVTFYLDDIRRAAAGTQGSPQEIWRNTTFHRHGEGKGVSAADLPLSSYEDKLILEQELSFAEEDVGAVGRTSFLYQAEAPVTKGVFLGLQTRLWLAGNLENLSRYAALSDDRPVRSDIYKYTDQRVGMDRLYAAYLATPLTDLHVGIAAGYLEEIYSGVEGEILYRPFGKTLAAGASLARIDKRDSSAFLNLGRESDADISGHLDLYYEIPNTTLDARISLGRYLAGDFGGTFALRNRFRSGAVVEAFITATNESDKDVFGGDSNLYGGMSLKLPIGTHRYLPEGSEFHFNAHPIGRDKGQRLDSSLNLHRRSDPLSFSSLRQNWLSVLD